MELSPEILSMGLGTGVLAALGAFVFVFVLLGIGIYIYYAFAWMTIARKLRHKYPWLAWIPFANIALVLQLGGFHWALVFLALVPVLGWIALAVLGIISVWRIYEKRKYPGALSLVILAGFIPFVNWLAAVANIIIIGFVAWKDK